MHESNNAGSPLSLAELPVTPRFNPRECSARKGVRPSEETDSMVDRASRNADGGSLCVLNSAGRHSPPLARRDQTL